MIGWYAKKGGKSFGRKYNRAGDIDLSTAILFQIQLLEIQIKENA